MTLPRLALTFIGDEVGPSLAEMISFCRENRLSRLDMRTVDGYAVSSWAQGYGDFVIETHRAIQNLAYQFKTAFVVGAAYLDQVRTSCGNDPAVLKAVAQGYIILGDIDGYPKQSNLGDRAGALQLYDKAQSVLTSLPQDNDTRQLLQTAREHADGRRLPGERSRPRVRAGVSHWQGV